MNDSYGRDLDLNLLRVFVAVASTGSVTQAAARLYLTQPAISAALRRLKTAVGAPLFARSGRGLVLTQRGERLFAAVRPQLEAMIEATLAPPPFDPGTSDRTLRIGLSDTMESVLLPPLLRVLEREAPNMRMIALGIQFRTVGEALTSRAIDLAVTVADELPGTIKREALFIGQFVVLFDPRHVRVGRTLSEREYFAHQHVIVSYAGDLRGVVEDTLHKQRKVRCSLASFSHLGAVVDGSSLLATAPDVVAREIQKTRPHLKTRPFPLSMAGAPLELLWPVATDDDDACRFVRTHVARIARKLGRGSSAPV